MNPRDPVAINYSRGFGWSGSLLVEICPDPEPSTVSLSLNYDGRSEIGVYRATLGVDEYRQTLERVRRSGYSHLPQSTSPVPPETRFVHIGERAPGASSPVLSGFDVRDLPAEIAALHDDLESGVLARIRKHPERVLSVTAAWEKPILDPREPIRVRVKLVSVGALPIVVGNPLAATMAWNGLSLAIRDASDHEDGVRLNMTHMRPPPGAPTGPDVNLVPGAALTFSFEKKVYLPPGRYEGLLAYTSIVPSESTADDEEPDEGGLGGPVTEQDEEDPQIVEGEVWVALGPLVIEAPQP